MVLGKVRADGSGDRRDIDRDRGVHSDQFPDTDRLVIFRAHVRRDAGHYVNGVACPGTVVIAARGKLRIALAIDLDRVLRQRRQFLR
jgi:hypothetical protein